MPTYSYLCDACGSEFEKEQRISEPAIKKCPKCGKLKARRMITGGNFILKGGGWYSDGYGSSNKSSGKSGSKAPEATKDAKDTSATTPSTSTDAKPSTPAPTTSSSSDSSD